MFIRIKDTLVRSEHIMSMGLSKYDKDTILVFTSDASNPITINFDFLSNPSASQELDRITKILNDENQS